MQYLTLLKKIGMASALVFALALSASFVMPAAPASAANSPGLCHDSFGGVTYHCSQINYEVKVDGKANGKFAKDKCYIYSDPNKGWQAADCNNSRFTTTTTITPAGRKVDDAANKKCPPELASPDGGCDLIKRYLNPAIKYLSIAVGLVVTISIVVGGIQYMTARNNPQAISAAKTRITNALLGFVAYMLLWGFLQWLVPGGFLNG